ncbi:MAG: YjgN family protein [Candidatus Rokuibacteriota bacterium]
MTAAPATAAAGGSRRLTFHGSGGTLFGIYVVNVLLTIVTLGFYRFWGKVKIRRFMLSQTGFEGDRFAYHGTGQELLNGFVKALLFVGMPITALSAAARLSGDTTIHIATQVFTSLLVFVFIPVAMVGARRYRLSRTSWRGIRFSFRGRAWAFVRIFTVSSLLSAVTLTLYYPFFQARQQAFMVSNSHFGRRPFRFDGRGRDLLGAYVIALLLLVPTLGIYFFWFNARKTRYFWEHTYFETARFRSTMTGSRLMVQTLGNWCMLILTLGLAWPWVLVRRTRFEFACLTVEGPLDLAGIVQEPQLATATGDALSSLLGADVGFA